MMRARELWLVAGLAAVALALGPPLHRLSESLFTAHMLQYELLMTVAAPLLVAGFPLAAVARRLPRRLQRALGRAGWRRALSRAWHVLTRPGIAFVLQLAVIWMWHAPILFDLSVTHPVAHGLQQASFVWAALLFWTSVLRPRHGGEGVAVMSLFFTTLHTTLLGAFLALAERPWFLAYAGRTEAYGYSLLADQRLGGYLMWMPGGMAYAAVAFVLVGRWLAPPKRRALAVPLALAAWGRYTLR